MQQHLTGGWGQFTAKKIVIELGFLEGGGINIYIKTNTIKSIMRTDSS